MKTVRKNIYHEKELTISEFKEMLESYFPHVDLYGQNTDPTSLKIKDINKRVSELQWEMNNLPITLIKKLIKRTGITIDESNKKHMHENFSIDMIRINKQAIEDAEIIIAVCGKD